jgi:Xaa-Pro aminopeptidase
MRDGIETVTSSAWVDVAGPLESVRAAKFPDEIECMRRAGVVADLVQTTVKEEAADGVREVDLATRAVARAWESVGRRFPILLTLTAGAGTAAIGGWEPTERRIAAGELVCADTAPWLDGYWSDTCNAVVVGEPTDRQAEVFAVVQRALQAGLAAARPGVEARRVDEACRSVMREAGHEYPHHSGHGLGLAHTEPPRITPDSQEIIREGMVIALEPGAYVEGWGGFRHEHVFVVRALENELLTRFEHVL